MKIEQQLQHIVTMQIELNERTVANWRTKGLDWDTAILVEVAEAIDSTDWKWWKHTETDLANLRVEAVDLLHFLVSKALDSDQDEAHVVAGLAQVWAQANKTADPVLCLKSMARHTLNQDVFAACLALFELFGFLNMDMTAVYQAYISKNLLNHYRQERGYKDPQGGYLKMINGEEDNVVFARMVGLHAEQAADLADLKQRTFLAMDQQVAAAR